MTIITPSFTIKSSIKPCLTLALVGLVIDSITSGAELIKRPALVIISPLFHTAVVPIAAGLLLFWTVFDPITTLQFCNAGAI